MQAIGIRSGVPLKRNQGEDIVYALSKDNGVHKRTGKEVAFLFKLNKQGLQSREIVTSLNVVECHTNVSSFGENGH